MKMMMIKGRFLRAFLYKWRKLNSTAGTLIKGRFLRAFLYKWRKLNSTAGTYEGRCRWAKWPCFNGGDGHDGDGDDNELVIPTDVPKGHLVVYVGEDCKRYVIRVSFLEHPLFKELLEKAREEYDFTTPDMRLCIPCDNNMFLSILGCVTKQQERIICLQRC